MSLRSYLMALPALSLLGACASAPGEYPTLALRDMERVTGTMAVPAAPPYVPPAPAGQTLDRAASVAEQARAAHAAFVSASQAVRRRVSAAAGAAMGSERWAVAQVALAELQTHRSQSTIALADLDRIYIEIANQGESLVEVGAIRGQVEQLVAAEDDVLADLLGALAR